ncbi:Glycosyltransferase, GT2 family [Polaromonas sp. OV174]|uniref:glycosyltransferase family 2 protein n=1 Tax=Polaromonas sp. OV174 TaxID=1855300 RepID=UPI0008E6E5BD|nr:glycosyltransferase family 2 protein [Polaromonas sp. OV174]SFC17189.1 Glycosyltransferase, GT2 family [Polaromonas sp. OV174]
MSVKVAVVIVNWNGKAHLRDCLVSLSRQTHADFQALVVDNASSDGSQQIVHEMNDDRFSLLQLDENTGFAKANNLGVSHGGGCKWVALLNPDAFPEPCWLETLLATANENASFAAFGGHLISAHDHLLSDGTGDAYNFSGRAYRRDHGSPVELSHREREEVFSPCAAAALYRRDAWDAVGGFDEDFFCYMEDVDLVFRMRLQGYRSMYIPRAVCYHVGSAMSGRHSAFSSYHGQRNLVWVYVKNMPSWLFWLLLPAHIGFNMLAVARFALRGQLGIVLRAKRDALSALPQVWQKRRRIQAQRTVSPAKIWTALDKSLWPKH